MIFLERTLFQRQMMRELPHPRQRHLHYTLMEFTAKVKGRVRWLLSAPDRGTPTPEDVRRLTGRVCDTYRDQHFKEQNTDLAHRGN